MDTCVENHNDFAKSKGVGKSVIAKHWFHLKILILPPVPVPPKLKPPKPPGLVAVLPNVPVLVPPPSPVPNPKVDPVPKPDPVPPNPPGFKLNKPPPEVPVCKKRKEKLKKL